MGGRVNVDGPLPEEVIAQFQFDRALHTDHTNPLVLSSQDVDSPAVLLSTLVDQHGYEIKSCAERGKVTDFRLIYTLVKNSTGKK